MPRSSLLLTLAVSYHLVCVPVSQCASTTTSTSSSVGAVDTVRGLISRLLPAHSERFILEEIELGDARYGVFEIDSDFQESKVVLRGSSGVELASAFNWYLKDYCGAMVSWTGDQLELPDPLPLPQRRRTERTMEFTYYQNTCTASYSFSFYDWAKWEREIDWMALNGVNFPLAFNGQEYVFALTYEYFNLSFSDLADFFAGPAFQTWQRMGNMYEWGGPQSIKFVEDQRDMQLRILERMRSYGMTPILTAFGGTIPQRLMEVYPGATYTPSGWGSDFPPTYLLDITDPLYLEIGSKFIEIQTEVYGTSHYYSVDTFNENVPPSNDPEYLRASAEGVYESIRVSDPDAIWIMQGWLFYDHDEFWELPQVEGLLSGVPDDKMIILDLFTETFPVWQDVNAFFGKSFIWCHLHNFGGRLGMQGRTQVISTNVQRDFHNPNISMIGIGLTMESINQNYIVYDLMLEQAYRSDATDMTAWVSGTGLSSWVGRRYGAEVADNVELFGHLSNAWSLLQRSVYSGDAIRIAPVQLATHPTLVEPERFHTLTDDSTSQLSASSKSARTQTDLFEALAAFVESARVAMSSPDSTLADGDTFQFDIVDLTREVLTEIFEEYRLQFSQGYYSRDLALLNRYAPLMLELIEDLDELLCSQRMFLLGSWIQDARRLAPSGEEDNFEYNARKQITAWGPTFYLNDYATKQWCGVVGDYFYHRYSEFTEEVISAVENREAFDPDAFEARMFDYAVNWALETDPDGVKFPNTTRGRNVEIAVRLAEKYIKVLA